MLIKRYQKTNKYFKNYLFMKNIFKFFWTIFKMHIKLITKFFILKKLSPPEF